jgi:hypothetical protein
MWLSSASLARNNQQRFPDQYMLIRYETLTTNPGGTLQEICTFIGEEYVPTMLTMKGDMDFRRQGSNSSYGEFTTGQISTSSIGRFRQVLSSRQIAFVQKLAGREMSGFDYQPELIELSLRDQLLFTFADWPFNQARMQLWRIRHWMLNQVGRSLPNYRIVTNPGS